MELSFIHVLNLSISASWLVVAVMLLRFLWKNAPKGLRCILWALVALRLICPVSIESDFSLLPSREVIPEHYLTMEPAGQDSPARLEIITNPVYPDEIQLDTQTTVARVQNWDLFASLIWLTGIGAMGIYAVYSYLTVRLRVRMSAWIRENIWECDELDTPFILGLVRPRIYLPSDLDEITRTHVLAHEKAHLKRLDHIWKPLGFALLMIHWFNPMMWIAYILLCRDIELACDERVIRDLDHRQVRAYSEALIACSVSHRMIAACPLAFGEVGVGSRIKSMLRYKKPGFWVIAAALVLSITLALCFLTDPVGTAFNLKDITKENGCYILSKERTPQTITLRKDQLPKDLTYGMHEDFDPGQIVLWQSETTTLYLESIDVQSEELMLYMDFLYELPESGTILVPYEIRNGEAWSTAVMMDDYTAWDASTEYPNAIKGRSYGPGTEFGLGLKLDVWNQAAEYVQFEIARLYAVTYSNTPQETTPIIVYGSYTLKGGSIHTPSFRLGSDGTFTLTTSPLSSYLGIGNYTLENGTLHLITSDGLFSWYFHQEESGAYLFDAEASDPISCLTMEGEYLDVPDGAAFIPNEAAITTDPLHAAIEAAILEENRSDRTGSNICVAQWHILDSVEASGTPLFGIGDHTTIVTVYLDAMYQEFSRFGISLESETASIFPAALTFRTDGVNYTLTEYWVPRDGIYYSDDIKGKFTRTAQDIFFDSHAEMMQQLSEGCAQQAEQLLLSEPTLSDHIASLLKRICSSPAQSSAPGEYIAAHPEDYRELVSMGQYTVRYCFEQFTKGDQMGLEGHIMALACQDILGPTDSDAVFDGYMTGQAWFNLYARDSEALREEIGTEEFEKFHPYRALALSLLGI